MKQLYRVALFFIVFLPFNLSAQPAAGLAAYYSFSGNANDGSGNGNNGTANGAVLVPDSSGNPNSAYKFNGTSAYINVPSSSSLQTADSVSIIFWAKRNRFGIDPILEKGGDWNTNDPNYGVGFHSVNNNMFYFWFDGGWRGADGVSDTAWHHYAVVAKNGDSNPTMYIDGVSVSVIYQGGAGTMSLNSATTLDLHIGAQVAGGNTLYGENTIDEIRIYHRLLTADDIADYPLPAELRSFTTVLKGNGVELVWQTATEVKNHGFEVERSEVRGQKSDWRTIGFVAGNGSSNSPKSYSFFDATARGNVIYRLKQIDNDGKFEYSNEVEVTISQTPQKFVLEQNYPNPFNPATEIRYQMSEVGLVSLKVFDMLGREVATLVNEVKEVGEYSAKFDATQYPSGIYFYTLRTNNFTATKKMLMLK